MTSFWLPDKRADFPYRHLKVEVESFRDILPVCLEQTCTTVDDHKNKPKEIMSRKGNRNTSFGVKEGHYLVGNQGIYKVCEFLGEGSFGKVAKCTKLGSQEFCAIKIMKGNNAGLREMETMKLIKHLDPDKNHLIKMYECFSFQNMTCIVYEILEESLYDFFHKYKHPIHLCHIRVMAQQLLTALEAINGMGLTHCDIKMDNIMFIKPNCINVKLIDFGLALKTEKLATMYRVQVTPFRAPEVILGLFPLNESVDMWALGMVLATSYFGYGPFPYETEYDTIRAMVQIFGLPEPEVLEKAEHTRGFFVLDSEGDNLGWRLQTPEEHEQITGNQVNFKNCMTNLYAKIESHQQKFDQHDDNDHRIFIDLLKRMLEVNPHKRITPSQALAHDFITMKHLPRESNAAYAAMAEDFMEEASNPSSSSSSSLSSSQTSNGSLKTPESNSSSCGSNSLSLKNQVSEGSVAKVTDMREVPCAGSVEEQPTHLSLNRPSCDPCEKPMPQENLEKTEALQTDGDEAQMPTGIKKRKKVFVVKKDTVLIGNLGNYQVGDLLGEGSYGKVFKCYKEGTEEVYAIKIIKDVNDGKEEVKAMELISGLDPDENNLIKFYEHFTYRNVNCLVYEILDQRLYDYMHEPTHLCNIRGVAEQMFQALNALKSIGVVHGDIKLDNILFAEENSLRMKLIDFGFARKAKELLKGTNIQTTPFRAPEVILGLQLDESIDMWALGMVLACLYCRGYPFPRKTEYATLKAMVQMFGLPEEDLLTAGEYTDGYFTRDEDSNDPGWRMLTEDEYTEYGLEKLEDEFYVVNLDAKIEVHQKTFDQHNDNDHRVFLDLLKRMLEVNPQKRITPSQALAHDFITMKHLSGESNASYAAMAKNVMGIPSSSSSSSLSSSQTSNGSLKTPESNSSLCGKNK